MMDPDSLTGRIAVVTRGGSAPGGPWSGHFAEVGMAVCALDLDEAVAACAASWSGEPKVRTMG